jgi:hypothetical protein
VLAVWCAWLLKGDSLNSTAIHTTLQHICTITAIVSTQQQWPHWQHIYTTPKLKSRDCLHSTALHTLSAHLHTTIKTGTAAMKGWTPKKQNYTLIPRRMVHQCWLRCGKHISNFWTPTAKYYNVCSRMNSLHHAVENIFLEGECQQRNIAVSLKAAVHQCLQGCGQHIISIIHFIPLISTNF